MEHLRTTTFDRKPPFTPLILGLPKESEPYVASRSRLPYDNAASVRRLHRVLTCSGVVVFPALRKQGASQRSGGRLSLPLMRPWLSHRGGITPIIHKHIRSLPRRPLRWPATPPPRLCCFSAAAKAQRPEPSVALHHSLTPFQTQQVQN